MCLYIYSHNVIIRKPAQVETIQTQDMFVLQYMFAIIIKVTISLHQI